MFGMRDQKAYFAELAEKFGIFEIPPKVGASTQLAYT